MSDPLRTVGGLPVIRSDRVQQDWIDYNGHLNAGFTAVLFDSSLAAWWSLCGLGDAYREAAGVTTFTVESHTTFLREMRLNEKFLLTAQLLDWTDKKVHTFLRLIREEGGELMATYELMTLHIDLATRRSGPMAAAVQNRLREIGAEHARLPLPAQAGRLISIDSGAPPR